jgi:hypothetical protein
MARGIQHRLRGPYRVLRAAVFLTASLGGYIPVQIPCVVQCCISGHIAKYLYRRIGYRAPSLRAGGVLRGRACFDM